MLVLTRKLNEEIVIGDNIKVTVLQVKGNSVRLGIEAPRDVRIVRGELPAQQPMAEVTVVFSGDRSESGSRVDVVPFASAAAIERSVTKAPSRESGTATESPSVTFQQLLPAGLHRNRLKQIVDEVTGK